MASSRAHILHRVRPGTYHAVDDHVADGPGHRPPRGRRDQPGRRRVGPRSRARLRAGRAGGRGRSASSPAARRRSPRWAPRGSACGSRWSGSSATTRWAASCSTRSRRAASTRPPAGCPPGDRRASPSSSGTARTARSSRRPGPSPTPRTGDVPPALLARARHVHVGSYFLQPGLAAELPALFRAAHAAGATTSLDPNWDPDGALGRGLRRRCRRGRRAPPERGRGVPARRVGRRGGRGAVARGRGADRRRGGSPPGRSPGRGPGVAAGRVAGGAVAGRARTVAVKLGAAGGLAVGPDGERRPGARARRRPRRHDRRGRLVRRRVPRGVAGRRVAPWTRCGWRSRAGRSPRVPSAAPTASPRATRPRRPCEVEIGGAGG